MSRLRSVSRTALFLLVAAPLARAADLHLQILDGRTGQPIARTHVVILGDGSPALFRTFTTDPTSALTLDPQHASAIRLFIEGRAPCAPRPTPPFSVAATRSTGLVSPNTCNPAISAKPTPNTLTLFVRPKTAAEEQED